MKINWWTNISLDFPGVADTTSMTPCQSVYIVLSNQHTFFITRLLSVWIIPVPDYPTFCTWLCLKIGYSITQHWWFIIIVLINMFIWGTHCPFSDRPNNIFYPIPIPITVRVSIRYIPIIPHIPMCTSSLTIIHHIPRPFLTSPKHSWPFLSISNHLTITGHS